MNKTVGSIALAAVGIAALSYLVFGTSDEGRESSPPIEEEVAARELARSDTQDGNSVDPRTPSPAAQARDLPKPPAGKVVGVQEGSSVSEPSSEPLPPPPVGAATAAKSPVGPQLAPAAAERLDDALGIVHAKCIPSAAAGTEGSPAFTVDATVSEGQLRASMVALAAEGDEAAEMADCIAKELEGMQFDVGDHPDVASVSRRSPV